MKELPESKATQQADISDQRRHFLQAIGGAGLLGAASGLWAQNAAPVASPSVAVDSTSWTNAEVMSGKDDVLKIHSERPLTASATAEHMNFDVTPTRRMFVRNNLNIPKLDAAQHVIKLQGLVERPIEVTMDELLKMAAFNTQAMLECAGSGRSGYTPMPRGTPWPSTGGMGCPMWTGVSLSGLLKRAGLLPNAKHVAFIGADTGALQTVPKVIRSIPIDKAMERHTMLAYGMNGEPLTPTHGFPVRALVPGWAGSASIKWLTTIDVLEAPYKGPYMDESYRIPGVPIIPGEKMSPNALSTEAWPVKSIITAPAPNAKFVGNGRIQVAGRAWAGENQIRAVEVSFDEGVTWKDTDLKRPADKYAWTVFQFEFRPDRSGYHTVLARARDNRGNVQPMQPAWNPLGYFYNGVQRVGFVIENA